VASHSTRGALRRNVHVELTPLRPQHALQCDRSLGLARLKAREGFSTPLRVGRFALQSALEHAGSLRLSVEARDRIGFLAALLRRLAYFSLFPVEMRLDTESDRIADELWLRAGGDRTPSTTTREALARALGALVEE